MNITKSLPALLALLIAVVFATSSTVQAADGGAIPGVVGRVVAVSNGRVTLLVEGKKKDFTTDGSTTFVALGGGAGTISDVVEGSIVKIIPGASDTEPVKKIKVFKSEKK
ncbi:hypothetical protein BH09VER1_BH09VER1_07350 [soil metagenome]